MEEKKLAKISKKEYILRAAALLGVSNLEIDALEKDLDGTMPNDYIRRRCKYLFDLYDIYMSKEFNDHIDPDDDGLITLDDYAYRISKKGLSDTRVGDFWIVSSNLDVYLAKNLPKKSKDIKEEYHEISGKNNFLMSVLAKQIGIEATIFYKGTRTKYFAGTGSTPCNDEEQENYLLTRNFIKENEKLISGGSIVKGSPKRQFYDIDDIIEDTNKFIKKHYKKYHISNEERDETEEKIRREFIKQSLFNKIVFNTNEDNNSWGLIEGEDHRLRLAPVFGYNYCANVHSSNGSKHRVVDKKHDMLEDLIMHYSGETWFKEWIENDVINLDLEKAIEIMTRRTGVTLTDKEKEYYRFVIVDKMIQKVSNVVDYEYDKEKLTQNTEYGVSLVKRLKRRITLFRDNRKNRIYKRNIKRNEKKESRDER